MARMDYLDADAANDRVQELLSKLNRMRLSLLSSSCTRSFAASASR